MSNVGIYSGTFDPVHEGHLAFARQAIAACRLEKVYFLVEPRPRRKQGVRAFEHRLRMLQLAVEDDPALGYIIMDHDRFTVSETLPVLLARFEGAQLHMLVGEDVAWHMAEWPHIRDLTERVNFVIGHRKRAVRELESHILAIQKSKGLSFNYNILDTNLSSINSTDIRLALKRDEEPQGLPASTRRYISENGLYSSQDERTEAQEGHEA